VKLDSKVLIKENKLKLYFNKQTVFKTNDYFFAKCIGCEVDQDYTTYAKEFIINDI
jgi:hypothetical protein